MRLKTSLEGFQQAISMMTTESTNLNNYYANVTGYIDSVIDMINEHLREILNQARAIYPLCEEARERYLKINNLQSEMNRKIEEAEKNIKSEYDEKINNLKIGE